jgi:hypothetical protein
MALAPRILVFAVVALFYNVEAQEQIKAPDFGFELSVPGPAFKYPAVSLGAWTSLSEKSVLGIEAGYGGRGLFFRRERIDNTFQQTHRRYFVSVLYGYHLDASPWTHYDLTVGPYYMSMQAEIGQSFIDNMPEGALTAHSGADYQVKRYGILPGIGLRAFTGRASFGFRAQFPIFYEESDFENIQNPLLVLDFDPYEIEDYQREVSQISVGFVLSVSLGITFFRRTQTN